MVDNTAALILVSLEDHYRRLKQKAYDLCLDAKDAISQPLAG